MKPYFSFALGCALLVCGGLLQAAATKLDDSESFPAQVDTSSAEDVTVSVTSANTEASASASAVKVEDNSQQKNNSRLELFKRRMANQNSYAGNSTDCSPTCNWRFIFSPSPNICDCHGSYPTTLMANDCQPHTGYTMRDGQKVFFSSISANLHGKGYGVAYFWADNACRQMADSLTLHDNTGAAFTVWTTDGYYRQSCYCCGASGPCHC